MEYELSVIKVIKCNNFGYYLVLLEVQENENKKLRRNQRRKNQHC